MQVFPFPSSLSTALLRLYLLAESDLSLPVEAAKHSGQFKAAETFPRLSVRLADGSLNQCREALTFFKKVATDYEEGRVDEERMSMPPRPSDTPPPSL